MSRDKRHDAAVKEWKIVRRAFDSLIESNCKGVPVDFLEITLRSVKRLIADLKGDDGVHINQVSEYFGVTNVTIRTWLKRDNLQKPQRKADEERSYITMETFNRLRDLHSQD